MNSLESDISNFSFRKASSANVFDDTIEATLSFSAKYGTREIVSFLQWTSLKPLCFGGPLTKIAK
jgi:hypothetical protein